MSGLSRKAKCATMGGKGRMIMALKEKALKRLTEKLTAAGVPFVLGGSWLLTQRGVLPEYHDFDVLTAPEQAAAADRVLSRLGMRSEAQERDGCFHAAYHFDGADIDLCAGMAFDGGLRAVIDAGSEAEKTPVLGAQVPVGWVEDWLVWYSLMGRDSRAEACLRYFAEHAANRERFTACVDGPLPEALTARIREAIG